MNLGSKRQPAAFLLLVSSLVSACNGDGDRTLGGGASSAPVTRYSMANGCYVLRDVETQQFVRTSGSGVSTDASNLGDATPFFMKASGLGRYLLFDPQERFVSLVAPNDALVDLGQDILKQLGWQLAHMGD